MAEEDETLLTDYEREEQEEVQQYDEVQRKQTVSDTGNHDVNKLLKLRVECREGSLTVTTRSGRTATQSWKIR
jgi:hypothetical protein